MPVTPAGVAGEAVTEIAGEPVGGGIEHVVAAAGHALAGHAEAVSIQQSSGYRVLDDAAAEAVRKWRFVPAQKGGGSTAGLVDVPVSFKLTD